ncbi:MAG: hypothetical protein AAGK02_14985, partial [Pseudomonadota bacterium]
RPISEVTSAKRSSSCARYAGMITPLLCHDLKAFIGLVHQQGLQNLKAEDRRGQITNLGCNLAFARLADIGF